MACATDKMEAQIERYLTTYHDGQITELLNKPDEMLHASVGVSLTHLARNEPSLYDALTARPTLELAKWDRSLWQAQMSRVEGPYLSLEAGFQLKHNCHVRFTSMPTSSSQREHGAKKNKGTYPKLDQLGRLVEVSGTVVRMTRSPKFVEFKRDYVCNRCRLEFVVEALYAEKYVFVVPRACPNATETGCKGTPKQKNDQPLPDYCHSCQEIRIQKDAGHSNSANSIEVTLENDLVDSCLPGDRVRIIGTVELRSSPGIVGKQTELTLTLNANSLTKDGHTMNNNEKNFAADLCLVRTEWQGTVDEIGELAARDLLVQSICPEIHGMYPVKLAIVLALASCAQRDLGNTTVTRLSSHLLLVGDPGLAKSRLLRFAADVSSRSVFTTGTGCSAAGLTAAAVQEDGEWQLEAGALVIADGGICCIDEFSSMQKKDMASIHEAMEQQTISVAKAGIRCTLAARCTILAATNPKTPFSVTDHAGASVNIGVEGPLLSRFDLVLLLRDQYDPEWYMAVCDHILSLSVVDEAKADFQQISPDSCWPMDTLQRHFRAIQQIDPKFSEGAQTVLTVRLVAKALNLQLNLIHIDLGKEEQLKPEFIKINPQHVIPTLMDDGFILWESRAILAYLCEKYAKEDSLYPRDPQKRAVINQRLYFDMGTLYQRFALHYYPQVLEGKPAPEGTFKQFEDALHFLETFLSQSKYLAGDSLTIADISLLATITTFKVAAGLDLSRYGNIERWYGLVSASVAGHDEICVQGSKQFAPFFINAKQ